MYIYNIYIIYVYVDIYIYIYIYIYKYIYICIYMIITIIITLYAFLFGNVTECKLNDETFKICLYFIIIHIYIE